VAVKVACNQMAPSAVRLMIARNGILRQNNFLALAVKICHA
jgi:hypothetical protein